MDKPIINHKELIAYFSMEIGLDEKIPTYAGGLGVLAGDYIKSAADLEAPVVGLFHAEIRSRRKPERGGNALESWEIYDCR
jgi:starch phosphorylase